MSETATFTVYVPVFVGVPPSFALLPSWEEFIPSGSPVIIHVRTVPDVAPLVSISAAYSSPTLPSGSVSVVITSWETGVTCAGDIASVNSFDTECTPFVDVALTVNLKLPASVGVPEITPAVLSSSPFGNEPLSTAHVTADGVALSVWL